MATRSVDRASNGDQKEDKTLLQHSQLSQHGEFRHVSVSERQQSRPCGQNLRVPFLRTVLPPEVDGALEQWWPTARQKRSYLLDQGEFQHQFYTFRSVLDSDHGSVVRIFVGQSQVLEHYIYYLYYTRGNRTPGSSRCNRLQLAGSASYRGIATHNCQHGELWRQ